MKLLISIAVIALSMHCFDASTKGVQGGKMDGYWKPISEQIGKTTLPATAFEKQRLTVKDTTYIFFAESVDKGVVRTNGDRVDIFGKEGVNAGNHFNAIYKIENDQLTICYNLKGDGFPGSFETKGNSNFFLCVFVRDPSGGM